MCKEHNQPRGADSKSYTVMVEKGLMKTHSPRCDTFMNEKCHYSKTCLKLPLKRKKPKIGFQD